MALDQDATKDVLGSLRKAFRSGATRGSSWRKRQLQAVLRMLDEREADIIAALRHDLGRSLTEAHIEIAQTKSAAKFALRNVGAWMKTRTVPTNLINWPAVSQVIPEAYGVVLILGPWNYPFLLLLDPLIGAVSAGNAVVAKPSEVASASSALLAQIVPQYLDPSAIRIVEGGPEVAAALLEEKWDKIFFTGGGAVGTKVALAAAAKLTPVTLELGGKNPAYIDGSAKLDTCLKRLASSRCYNAGQICLCPDYVMVQKDVADLVTDQLVAIWKQFYGQDPSTSPDLARIINEHHFDRIQRLLRHPEVEGRIVHGGESIREERFIAPTLLRDVPWDAPIMQEEIFGPILVVQTVKDLDEALEIVASRPKPLATYVFTEKREVFERFVAETSSGGIVHNDIYAHFSNPNLPFGGVGDSGMGAYHGKASFECFSHEKAVMRRAAGDEPSWRYPPTNQGSAAMIGAMIASDWWKAVTLALGLSLKPQASLGPASTDVGKVHDSTALIGATRKP